VELDPNFAVAYGYWEVACFVLNEAARGAENIRKAHDLREKASEREGKQLFCLLDAPEAMSVTFGVLSSGIWPTRRRNGSMPGFLRLTDREVAGGMSLHDVDPVAVECGVALAIFLGLGEGADIDPVVEGTAVSLPLGSALNLCVSTRMVTSCLPSGPACGL
jgi:hypothetical protein